MRALPFTTGHLVFPIQSKPLKFGMDLTFTNTYIRSLCLMCPYPPNETLLLVVLHVMSHHAFDNDATNPSPHRAIQLHRVNARVPLCKAILTQSPWWNALDNMKMEYNQVTTNHVLCSRTPFGSGITHMEWPPLPLMAFKYT